MKSAKVTSSHVFSTLKLHFPMAFQWLQRTEKRARKPLIQRVQPGPTGLSRIIPGSSPDPFLHQDLAHQFPVRLDGAPGPRAQNRLQHGAKKSNFTVFFFGAELSIDGFRGIKSNLFLVHLYAMVIYIVHGN